MCGSKTTMRDLTGYCNRVKTVNGLFASTNGVEMVRWGLFETLWNREKIENISVSSFSDFQLKSCFLVSASL